MLSRLFQVIVITVFYISFSLAANAQTITASGKYHGPPGFPRGMASTTWCGNNHWVRFNAILDKGSDQLTLTLQLETDDLKAGPKGIGAVALLSPQGVLANITSDEAGIKGKPPGGAVIKNITKTINLDHKLSQKVTSMYATTKCTGQTVGPFGFDPNDIMNAVKIGITVLGSSG